MFVRQSLRALRPSLVLRNSVNVFAVRASCLAAVFAACITTSFAHAREPDDPDAKDQSHRRASDLPTAVDAIAKRWIDEKGVVGMSVAVVQNGQTLLLKGYGKAHVELDVPTPERAVYEIASEAKTFTAVAILRLVEQGKLSLDDSLIRHLPGVLPDETARKVSIRQLLTHTSGVHEFTAIPAWEALAPQALPQEQLVRPLGCALSFPTLSNGQAPAACWSSLPLPWDKSRRDRNPSDTHQASCYAPFADGA